MRRVLLTAGKHPDPDLATWARPAVQGNLEGPGHQAEERVRLVRGHLAGWAHQAHRVVWVLVEGWDHPEAREGAGSKQARPHAHILNVVCLREERAEAEGSS
ncbi:MAG: hypothetical protein H8K04_02330 [Nitrospira sp.]